MKDKNTRLEVVMKRIEDISPYTHNPRNNGATAIKLKKSIEAFGFKNPIILDENDIIVCGHARFKAAMMLGMEEVPCIYAYGLTDDEINAFRIADNKTAEIAGWDYDKLCDEMRDLMQNGFEMALTGFNEAEQFAYLQDDMLPDKPDRDAFREYEDDAEAEILQVTNIIIVCENDSDKAFMQNLFGIEKPLKRLYHGEDIRAAIDRRNASE